MSNTFFESFTFIADNHSYILNRLYSHLEISGVAMGISLLIGLPIGLLLGHIHRFSFIAINTSNLGRALPSVGVLALFLPLVGVGETDVIIALVILAFPPILTNTYVAVDQVDADTVDAARGIGLRGWQVLTRVELPLALPLIFAGIRTSTVFVIATATLAGFFGGGGLGDIIADQASYKLQGVLGATYVLIALAFVSQLVFLVIERSLTPAGLKINQRPSRFRSRPGNEALITQGGGDAVEEEIADASSFGDDPAPHATDQRSLEKGRSS